MNIVVEYEEMLVSVEAEFNVTCDHDYFYNTEWDIDLINWAVEGVDVPNDRMHPKLLTLLEEIAQDKYKEQSW